MEAKIESIKIRVGEKIVELSEDEAISIQYQLNKLFAMGSPLMPIPYPVYPSYPNITEGDHTGHFTPDVVVTICGNS